MELLGLAQSRIYEAEHGSSASQGVGIRCRMLSRCVCVGMVVVIVLRKKINT